MKHDPLTKLNYRKDGAMAKTATKPKQKKDGIGNTEIKVTVQIPDNVRNRQEKINRIYDILKPVKAQ